MTTTRKKRPHDPIQFARLISDIATGRVEDAEYDRKDEAAAVGEYAQEAIAVIGRTRGGSAVAEAVPDHRAIGPRTCATGSPPGNFLRRLAADYVHRVKVY